jgi:hypothetical protein
MKNRSLMTWVLAFMLVFGMAVVGCGDGDDGDDGGDDWENGTNWHKWGSGITALVDDDGVITVNINAVSGLDTCGINLPYSGSKNKTYKYVFEAWTKSDSRNIRVCFGTEKIYEHGDGPVWYPNEQITINSTKQIFELEYEISNIWVDFCLGFNCGGEIGEFYVKIISIEQKQ